MIKQEIWKFVRAGMNMSDFQTALDLLVAHGDQIGMGIAPTFRGIRIEDMNEDKKNEFKKFLSELRFFSENLDLKTSRVLLIVAERDTPKTSREFHQIILSISAELHGKLFFYIPDERAGYWECDDILSRDAREAFRGPYLELREAANCYAAERYDACVFHSTRAAEIGLRELGRDLGVVFKDKPIDLAEEQNIIDQIENKIADKVKRPIGDSEEASRRDADRKFYSEIARQFRYIKDGWHVRVAHGRESFTGSRALSILSHTREFFEDLSTRLTETL
jgi:hypothetical protein